MKFGSLSEKLFKELFGKYLPGSYDSQGNFIPGDIQNRISQAQKWIVVYNAENKYNPAILKELLTRPSGWQSATQSYLSSFSQKTFHITIPEILILIVGIYFLSKK